VALVHVGVFCAKTAFVIWFFVWVRWTLPRFRYDQLMRLSWRILLPLSVINLVVTALILAFFR
jgi:NADH-quinone oxidoreductase subunit H